MEKTTAAKESETDRPASSSSTSLKRNGLSELLRIFVSNTEGAQGPANARFLEESLDNLRKLRYEGELMEVFPEEKAFPCETHPEGGALWDERNRDFVLSKEGVRRLDPCTGIDLDAGEFEKLKTRYEEIVAHLREASALADRLEEDFSRAYRKGKAERKKRYPETTQALREARKLKESKDNGAFKGLKKAWDRETAKARRKVVDAIKKEGFPVEWKAEKAPTPVVKDEKRKGRLPAARGPNKKEKGKTALLGVQKRSTPKPSGASR